MAVSPAQPSDLQAADLREFRAADLAALLDEQTAYWMSRYRWDFSASRDVILRYIEMRNLYGYALLEGKTPIGYSYFILENRKALIGDVFITETRRAEQPERLLLYQTLQSAAVFPGVRRIEGQLLALSFNPAEEVVFARPLSVFERNFMLLEGLPALQPHPASRSLRFYRWSDQDLDAGAELIAHAYESHVDSRINDQYCNAAGARRFLYNSTQHPGCGVFFREAALTAVDPISGRLCGLCLGSLVQAKVGHITQLCVTPHMQGRGIGYELLRRAIEAFRGHGCDALSLTVTASNRGAIELYERLGFRTLKKFFAFVWEA